MGHPLRLAPGSPNTRCAWHAGAPTLAALGTREPQHPQRSGTREPKHGGALAIGEHRHRLF